MDDNAKQVEPHYRTDFRRPAQVGPYELLVMDLITRAAHRLKMWSITYHHSDEVDPGLFVGIHRRAFRADAWLTATEPQEDAITFRDACDLLQVDPDAFIEKLYATLDDVAVNALWTGKPPDHRKRHLQFTKENRRVDHSRELPHEGIASDRILNT